MGTPSSYVPHDIVEDILSKLPVRSLIRFKAVSNNFLSLISSPRFISAHYKNSMTRPSSFMICPTDTFPNLQLMKPNVPVLEVIDLPPLNDILEFVGCANGIACIKAFCVSDNGYERTFMLWNPATKQYNHVIPCPSYHGTCSLEVGFSYHAGIEDYKLFVMPCGVSHYKYKPQVLQLRRGTWREIDTCIGLRHNFYSYYSSPVVVTGVWYQVWRIDSGPKILSFDLKEDSFALADPPFSDYEFSVALGVRDQKLCSFSMSDVCLCRGWMMVEEASWIEMFTIDVCSTIGGTPVGNYLRLLTTWQGTRLVLESYESYYVIDIGSPLHNSLTTTFEEVPKIERDTFSYKAFDFVESLVSPILLEF